MAYKSGILVQENRDYKCDRSMISNLLTARLAAERA